MNQQSVVRTLGEALPPVDAPLPPTVLEDWSSLHLAAVLVLLYPEEESLTFPLTVRPPTLTHHPGQISLPGGRVEPDDASPWDAAIRETEEEIGVDRAQIRPLGRLDPLPTVVSKHLIVPYVGWMPERPILHPDPFEVSEILAVPLDAILEAARIEEEVWELRGGEYLVTFYRIGGHAIWGATARVLSDLATRLEPTANPAYPPGWVRPVGG